MIRGSGTCTTFLYSRLPRCWRIQMELRSNRLLGLESTFSTQAKKASLHARSSDKSPVHTMVLSGSMSWPAWTNSAAMRMFLFCWRAISSGVTQRKSRSIVYLPTTSGLPRDCRRRRVIWKLSLETASIRGRWPLPSGRSGSPPRRSRSFTHCTMLDCTAWNNGVLSEWSTTLRSDPSLISHAAHSLWPRMTALIRGVWLHMFRASILAPALSNFLRQSVRP